MIGHTGYEVWCDNCKAPLGGATIHDTKTEAWRAAKAAGWTIVFGIDKTIESSKRLHYCPTCSAKKENGNGHS